MLGMTALDWETFSKWQAAYHIGDLASEAGLLLSAVGFAVSLYGIFSSRTAARNAEAAAREAVGRIRLIDEVVDLTFAITTIEEIRRLHRLREWPILLDRYATLRKTLITIRAVPGKLTDGQQKIVQGVLTTLQGIESSVEQAMPNPGTLDAAKFNNLLATETDSLQLAVTQLKATHTDVGHGKA